MALTAGEVEALRRHLQYGNIGVGAYPLSEGGFYEVFYDVISPYLSTGTETSATTAITANTTTTVTPASMTGIAVYGRLVVDADEAAEVVTVKAVTASTFVAAFKKAHAASGYPIATDSGVARLRLLLNDADKAFATMTGSTITSSAGLKSVGRGAVEWFGAGAVLSAVQQQYRAILDQIASLVQVPVNGDGRTTRLEMY
jgi:hypothetical protein